MNIKLIKKDEVFTGAFFTVHLSPLILILAWIIMQTLIFYQYGLVTSFEAKKYIDQADYFLKNGTLRSPNYWLYFVQVFLIAIALKLKTGLFSVALVQLFFNAWATYSFYRFILCASNKQVAFILALFLILNYPVQTFNVALQTESLFYSFTILLSCFLLSLKKLTGKTFIKIILFLVLISFTRPTGILFMPCVFLYLFFRFFQFFSIGTKLLITIVVSTGFLLLLNIALGSGGSLDFMLPFRDERIICGVPTLPHFINIRTADNPNSVFGLIYYLTHNTEQFLRLAGLRSRAFFGLTRSYYSFWHNFYLVVFFFPLYLVVIFSLKAWIQKNKFVLLYCASLILINWTTVILTCDDWHNRFFLTIAPYIYILTIPGLQKITDKLRIDGNKQIDQSESSNYSTNK